MSIKKCRNFLFVLPRYFSGIAGGAETLCGNLARALKERGDEVEIFTTCAKDNRTWENEFSPGVAIEDGVKVLRFPVDKRNLDSWIPKQISISQGMKIGVEEELEWMAEGVNSTALYEEILKKQQNFSRIFFAPYLFATTFWGSLLVPEKAVLIPCLHDETYAYLDTTSCMFRGVSGAMFNAKPEMELARRLYGEILGGEVGMGFLPFSENYISELNPYFEDSAPYVLYVGRKETGKNVQLLIDNFIFAKDEFGINPELKLVIAGGGDFSDLHRKAALERGDVVDIGHVSERDKHRLIRHADIFCQPSVNESFSIVIMEGWLLGTPALVHADCAVTKHHVLESGGGIYFRDELEFSEILRSLLSDKKIRDSMSKAGYQYVSKEYSWPAVLSRFDKVIESLTVNSDGASLYQR